MASRPRIAVTMGDPAGVGPEVCLHLLADESIRRECVPIVFGDADVLRRVAAAANLAFDAPVISAEEWPAAYAATARPAVLDLGAIAARDVQPGQTSAA